MSRDAEGRPRACTRRGLGWCPCPQWGLTCADTEKKTTLGVELTPAAERAEARLYRIGDALCKHVIEGGMTDGTCSECGHQWPCPTNIWATTARDAHATWDPADDEENDC